MGCSPWGHIELDTTSRESLSRECYQGGCTCSQFLDVEVRGELAKQASGDLSSRTTWPSHRGRPLPLSALHTLRGTGPSFDHTGPPARGSVARATAEDAGVGLIAACVLLVSVIGGRTRQSESFPGIQTPGGRSLFSSPSGLVITKALVKQDTEKAGLKLSIQKTKITASSPITSWQIDGETVETVTDLTFWFPKSLQMVTAAMKLKDAYSLEGKL